MNIKIRAFTSPYFFYFFFKKSIDLLTIVL
nr:MAG TPA: hypothetical protein [Caudoviricetes sp.]